MEDEVEILWFLLVWVNVFSIKGVLLDILLYLKDDWDHTLDSSTDVTKADADDEALKCFLFSEALWVYGEGLELILVSSFFEDLASWGFLKESTRSDFGFRSSVCDSRLEDFKSGSVSKEIWRRASLILDARKRLLVRSVSKSRRWVLESSRSLKEVTECEDQL